MTGPLRVLAHRDFRLIAIGNMVSQLGFWGQYVAVGWAARTLTESDFLVTVAFAAQWFPALLLSPIAGVFADRYDRRRLVLWGNIAMIAPPAMLGVLIQTDRITLFWLVALVLVGGAGQAFTQPAAAAYVPALVPVDDLHAAIALNAGMTNSTRVLGPALGGSLIAAWGVAWGFHVNAISFLAVAAACGLVRIRPSRPPHTGVGMLHDLRLGIAYTRANRAVARLMLLIAVSAFWMMHSALMPIFTRDVLDGDVSTYGLLSAAPGVGFVGAAVLTTMLHTERQRQTALVICSFGLGGAILLFALSRYVPLSLAALGVFGMCYMTIFTIVNSMLVAASHDEYRGRVMGVFAMCSVGAIPINSLLAGGLVSLLGAANTVLMCGVALTVFNIAFYASGSLAIIRGQPVAPHATT